MQGDNRRRPSWLVRRVPAGGSFAAVGELVQNLALHTVCQSADCPNLGECFGSGTATFLILGGVCTRGCRFCAIPKGKPKRPDPEEPERLAQAVRQLALRHVVITSVTRDDLLDGGAEQFAACLRAVRRLNPSTTTEVLVPDFGGSREDLNLVLSAQPQVLNHNIETVPRLYSSVRPGADYRRSLRLLSLSAGRSGTIVKSGMMVGLGESPEEVEEVFRDLRAAGVEAVTVGQYLQPSPRHLPVVEYVTPEQFAMYRDMARACGIAKVASGPLVRSSYRAAEMMWC